MTTDNATPRPWRFGRITTGTATRVIYGADKQPVLEIPYRFGSVETRAGNQALLLGAVNAYDAHRALVEACRHHRDSGHCNAVGIAEALAAVEAAEKGE